MRHRGKLFSLLSILFVFLPCIAMAQSLPDYFVPPNMTLSDGDTFNLGSGEVLSVSDIGRIDNSGTITSSGFIINQGTIANNAGGTIINNGNLLNRWTSTPDSRFISSYITNSGTFTNNASITNFGSITNNAGGIMINNGWIGGGAVYSTISGDRLAGSITNSGTFNNNGGEIALLGPITNNAGGIITNSNGRQERIYPSTSPMTAISPATPPSTQGFWG